MAATRSSPPPLQQEDRSGPLSASVLTLMLLSSPVNSKLAYAHAVETGKPGKTISSQEWGKAGRGRICSPRPDAHAVGPSKNRGTSDPRWAPNSWRAWDVRPVPKRRLSPHSVAAASHDPPPSPAPRG